jgi:hypothetical protein
MLVHDTLTGALHEVPDYMLHAPGLGEYDDGLGLPFLAALPAIAGAAGSLLGGGGGGSGGGGGQGGGGGAPMPQFIPIPTPQLVPLPIPIPYPVVRVPVPVPMPGFMGNSQAVSPYPASPFVPARARRRARRRR